MSVGEILDRKERPAYVRFERVPIEDKKASLQAGHYVAQDIDYALVTPPYSKDIFRAKVRSWLEQIEKDMNDGRVPKEWVDNYRKAYDMWKNGQEMPLKGSPIRGWGVISPAQQETLIRMNLLTIEDLSQINDEGLSRIGMGARDLKNKAIAWLSQLNDKGPLTQEVAELKSENDRLRSSVETLTSQVQGLIQAVKAREVDSVTPVTPPEPTITASDILDEPAIVAEPKRGPGRPKKA